MDDKTKAIKLGEMLDITSQFIADMILLEKIEIFDIPQDIRLSSPRYFVLAFRVYRVRSANKYYSTLDLLKNDIEQLRGKDKECFTRIYESYLQDKIYCEE